MENRGALRLQGWAYARTTVSAETSAAPRYAACGQPSPQRTAAGCQRSDPQPQLSRSSVPSLTHQAGCPKGHHGHAHPLARLVYRMLKYGQRYVDKRDRVLRTEIPQPTSPVAQKERNQTRIPDHGGPSLNSLLRSVSGEALRDRSTADT
jgi:hypothetical protein